MVLKQTDIGQQEVKAAAGSPEMAESLEDDHFLPPRRLVHPTEKGKWIGYFYRALLWLFVLLVAALLFWGWSLYRS